MSVTLKVSLGTVNYTDWLHVTAAKISSPTVVAWEDWINVPVTNYNFVIPNLDPENYIISYYDAATNVALGVLRMQLVVNALTGEFVSERRFYTCGGPNDGDPADGDSIITDAYLINKNVTGIFKEAFRYFEPITEFSFDDATGVIAVLNGTTFDTDEKMAVEIKYAVTSSSSSAGGLYTGTLTVTEDTKTLLSSDADKRIRCLGTTSKQSITLCALSTISVDRGFYFDNACGGMAVQVKILLPGTDRIRFNGFMAPSDLFVEFWVSKGEHLLIRKFDDDYWEVISDYAGVHVGEDVTIRLKTQAGVALYDGSELDGDEYGRLWWFINTLLPATHYINDDTGTVVAARVGQFIIKPSTKKIIMPNYQGLSKKALADFNTYGADAANRPYDYPGGFQDHMLLQHKHDLNLKLGDDDNGDYIDNSDNPGDNGHWIGKTEGITEDADVPTGPEQRIKNIGVIEGCRI